jgi:serine/threonine-protein kinase
VEEPPFVDSLIGLRIGGRYIVDKVLGAGGMGVVAMARYPELGQKVAIKFLLPQHAASTVLAARFMREARLAAMVKSEHFVRVFDIGRLPSGIPYLVMELLAGRDLGDELAERGALSVEQAVDYVLQAAVGIAEFHALGVVHRDLKPSNLFVAEAAGKRMIKVLDFGISKENASDSSAPLTATDNVLGTPQYMSPEQVRASKDVDARSDLWSLGVILFELLTAHRPFASTDNGVGEIFAKVLYIDPPRPREIRPELPEALEAVVMQCLVREPAGRFANVGELAEALRPFAATSSVHRIDAVHQALTTRRSMLPPAGDEPEGPAPSQVPTAELKEGRDDIASSPTVPSTPRLLAATARLDNNVAAPITVMTSSGSRPVESQPRRSSRVVAFSILGAVALVGVVSLGVAVRRGPTTPTPEPAATLPSSTGATTTAEPPVTTEPPIPTPPAVAASALDPAPAPAPATSTAHPTTTTTRPTHASTKAPARATPATSTKPKPALPADPILDRK